MRRRHQAQPQTALGSLLRLSKFIGLNQDTSTKTSAIESVDACTATNIPPVTTCTQPDASIISKDISNIDNNQNNNSTTTTTTAGASSSSSSSGTNYKQQNLTNKQAQRKLLQRSEVPVYLQDNPYILSHYREISPSITNSLHSLTYLHNETCNIYTHLIPCICILIFTIYFLTCSTIPLGLFFPITNDDSIGGGGGGGGGDNSTNTSTSALLSMSYNSSSFPIKTFVVTYQQHAKFYKNISGMDRIVLLIWLSTTGMCFGLSAVFHTLLNHSNEVAGLCLRMDYVGIVAGIVGNFVSGVYVGFWCEEDVWRAYWGMVCFLFFFFFFFFSFFKTQKNSSSSY